jgi:hypothetical protein
MAVVLMRFPVWLLLIPLVAGCDRLPQGDRLTPEVAGRLMRSGNPVSGASIIVVRRAKSLTPDACINTATSTRTDSAGFFTARAVRSWTTSSSASEESDESDEPFLLCVRGDEDTIYAPLFQGRSWRWDKLNVECDLDRAWLQPDRSGSTGRCLIIHKSVEGQSGEGQSIEQRPSRPAALTCDTTATLIDSRRVGPLRVHGSMDEFRRLCHAVRDTMLKDDPFSELPSDVPGFVMNIAGQAVPFFAGTGRGILRIDITSPVFRTREGWGVGALAIRLLEKPGLKVAYNGEAQPPHFVAWHEGPQCHTAYVIPRPRGDRPRALGQIAPNVLRELPDSTRIERIHIGMWCPDYHFPE